MSTHIKSFFILMLCGIIGYFAYQDYSHFTELSSTKKQLDDITKRYNDLANKNDELAIRYSQLKMNWLDSIYLANKSKRAPVVIRISHPLVDSVLILTDQ